MTPLKFRAWDGKTMWYPYAISRGGKPMFYDFDEIGETTDLVMQSTGLTDKNDPCVDVFEGDIVSPVGKVIGNLWQDPALLEDSSNLLIEGLGTETWVTTHQEAMARGLSYPKRHAD